MVMMIIIQIYTDVFSWFLTLQGQTGLYAVVDMITQYREKERERERGALQRSIGLYCGIYRAILTQMCIYIYYYQYATIIAPLWYHQNMIIVLLRVFIATVWYCYSIIISLYYYSIIVLLQYSIIVLQYSISYYLFICLFIHLLCNSVYFSSSPIISVSLLSYSCVAIVLFHAFV